MSQEQDKAFIRTFIGVIIFLTSITVGLIILASTTDVSFLDKERAVLEHDRAVERLQPVAAVRLSGEPMPAGLAPQAPAASGPLSGEQVVQQVCAACHASGVMNAPKIGTKADWEPRLAAGYDTLLGHAIHGLRAMPPRGGMASLSDEEVKAAVDDMLKESGLSAPAK